MLRRAGAAVFAAFAVLQYNDPDAPVWVAVYALAAAACWGADRGWGRVLSALVVAVTSAWSLWLLPGVVREPPRWSDVFAGRGMLAPGVEPAREVLGLALAAVWCACAAWFSRAPTSAGPGGSAGGEGAEV